MKFIIILLALLIPLGMLSGDSLWMDEAQTAHFATQPDLHAWYTALTGTRLSEVQMPLYMFSSWVSGQLWGTREWQLRLPNLFYAWAAIGAMWLVGRRRKLAGLPLLFAVSPFLGYYVNEARPYMLVLAASAWMLYGSIRLAESRGQDIRGLALFCVAGIVACATHMLAVFLLGGMVAVLLFQGWRERWSLDARHGRVLGLSLLVLLPLAAYYLWTLSHGGGGAKMWRVGVGNIIYVIYELLGVSAFGPPRHLLRETLVAHQGWPNLLGVLVPYGVGLLVIVGLYGALAFKMLRRGQPAPQAHDSQQPAAEGPRALRPVDAWLFAAMAVTSLVLLAAACLVKWPFWGRHLATIFPLLIYLIASRGRQALWRHPATGYPTWLGLALMLVLFAGELNQRFNPAYAKDDYRGSAAIVRQALAQNEAVWWAADPKSAQYYGLSLQSPASGGRLLLMEGLRAAALAGLPRPGKVVLARPDVDDAFGTIQAFLKDNHYQLVAHLTGIDVWGPAPAL